MSHVTNVLLCVADVDASNVKLLNDKLKSINQPVGFAPYISECGGTKGFEKLVYPAAFNYLDIEQFKKYVWDVPWIDREGVSCFICDQNDDKFTEV